MSSDGGKRQEDEEELLGVVSSDNDKNRKQKTDEIERKRKLQNKIRCQRYRDKRKSVMAFNSRISQHQTMTVEEEMKIKRRKEQDKLKSKRYRDKKRAANSINVQTYQPSKTIAKHIPELQNFHTSQIPGPSAGNVPYEYFAPTHRPSTAGPSERNELYIPESYPDYNAEVSNDIPSQGEEDDELIGTEEWWNEHDSIIDEPELVLSNVEEDDKSNIKLQTEDHDNIPTSSQIENAQMAVDTEENNQQQRRYSRKRLRTSRVTEDNTIDQEKSTHPNTQLKDQQKTKSICGAFGSYVSAKLESYSEYTRIMVEHKINEVLFQADFGTFNEPTANQQNEMKSSSHNVC